MAITFKVANGDIVVSAYSGRPTTITSKDKLIQDVVEFFTVDVTTYGFGAGISELVGMVEAYPELVASLATRNIRDGVNRLIALQRTGPNIYRSPDERIVGANNISVKVDPGDPTKFYFTMNVVTASGVVIPVPKIGFGA